MGVFAFNEDGFMVPEGDGVKFFILVALILGYTAANSNPLKKFWCNGY